jgi:CheY-like chemotaxis protein
MAHILVIDDEPDARDYVGRFLEKLGHTVAYAGNGREALTALLHTIPPDAVILDVRMPQMDGVQLLEVLRSYLRWYTLPVIVLSAHMTVEDINRLREMGVIYVFHKANYELAELGAAVLDATGNKDGGDPAA